MLPTIPSAEQMKAVSKFVRTYRGKVQLIIESCFSPLRTLTYQTALFGNLNTGINKGCLAGICHISVSVDGLFSPCRHLEYYESFPTLEEYWKKSEVLKRLRTMDQEDMVEPCESCRYKDYCRPCAAINSKLENKLYRETNTARSQKSDVRLFGTLIAVNCVHSCAAHQRKQTVFKAAITPEINILKNKIPQKNRLIGWITNPANWFLNAGISHCFGE